MESVLIVTNVNDGRRYRLVIKGNLRRITGAKVKKYMVSHVGAAATHMLLRFNGREMLDATTAGDMGVQSGDTITLEPVGGGGGGGVSPRSALPTHNGGAVSVASSMQQHAQLIEAESLDDQRDLFELETDKRQQQYTRTINEIAAEMSERERQAQLLDEDLKERVLQVQRIEAEKQAAFAEKARIEELRENELRKQQEREQELQRRQEQLMLEREQQKELELKRMELEKKQKLIEQQRLEAQQEKERVERDRRDYEERMHRQEEEVRERETQLERERHEHERRERELDRDKAKLLTQREFESQTFGKERALDEVRLQEIQRGVQRQMEIPVATLQADVHHVKQSEPSWSQPSPVPGHSHAAAHHDAAPAPAPEMVRLAAMQSAPALSPTTPHTHLATPNDSLDCDALAQANLEDLALNLGQPLAFDQSHTCVVDVDDKHTIMISYDRETEGLYVYSSLLCNLPRDPAVKLQLYEMLLEGSLLGRDMAGGGVGLSLKDDFILMCTSLPLRSCHTRALRLAVPPFSEALRRWRRRIKELLTDSTQGTPVVFPSAQPLPAAPPVTQQQQQQQQPPSVHVLQQPSQPQQQHSAVPQHMPHVQAPLAMPSEPSPSEWTGNGGSDHTELGEAYAVIGVELTDGVTIDGVHTQYNSGVIVVRVKGPAAVAGLLESDIIKFVNGRRVSNLQNFQEITATLAPELPCQFVVERAGGQEMTLEVIPSKGYKRPGEQKRYRAPADAVLMSARS